ncbi:37S ribosomal protein S9, mitochondrial [Coemansia sp. RSA 1933]|nr:37S ribosomal protein S9, mitochondrial [Coemansia sp. RSA 1933]
MLARLQLTGATRAPSLLASRRMLTQETTRTTQSSAFDSLEIRPVKRPDTPSYFMPKPKYSDMLAAVTSIVRQYEQPRKAKTGMKLKQTRKITWLNQKQMEEKFDFKLSINEFKDLRLRLKEASTAEIRGSGERKTVKLYLNQFAKEPEEDEGPLIVDGKPQKRPKKEVKRNRTRGFKDDLGRWTAGGRRKTALATVIVAQVKQPDPESDAAIADGLMAATTGIADLLAEIRSVAEEIESEGKSKRAATATEEEEAECEFIKEEPEETIEVVRHAPLGEILVNGRPLAEYFVREGDRDAVLLPLVMTESVGKYNVFLRIRGGGLSAQAEACQLALSRALFSSSRGKHAAIMKARLLDPDRRFVERKKTGKPKARKSYTWVKR